MLIYVSNWGLRRGPPEVIARLAAGGSVDAGEYYFRTTPVFETGAPEYAWLNGIIAVAAGERREFWIAVFPDKRNACHEACLCGR